MAVLKNAGLKVAGAALVAALAAGGADAQRMTVHGPGASYDPPRAEGAAPAPQPGVRPAPQPGYRPAAQTGYRSTSQPGYRSGPNRPGFAPSSRGHNWGGNVEGHWVGGMRAPGGWAAYRRPYRGYVLPTYWVAPTFFIGDYADYGLPQPPQGYYWSRYYDDAVLIDQRGAVYDSVGDVDWTGGNCATEACVANTQSYYRSAGYSQGGYDPAQGGDRRTDGYDTQGGYPRAGAGYQEPQRRDDGAGGALAGAAVGGVAGNLIAGRGHRLGGTLIGAGAGAAAGYAIDRGEDRGRQPPPAYDDRGAGYRAPGGYQAGGGYAPPTVIRSGNGTTVTTSSANGHPSGTYVNGYYYPPASVTTVTVTSAPVVTTTTEVFEDSVTYSRPKVHRKVRHRPTKIVPRCRCR